jgi:hypothetical protein
VGRQLGSALQELVQELVVVLGLRRRVAHARAWQQQSTLLVRLLRLRVPAAEIMQRCLPRLPRVLHSNHNERHRSVPGAELLAMVALATCADAVCMPDNPEASAHLL